MRFALVGLLARPPAADELELARSSDIQLEVTPCALDAFVLLVNSDNSIRNLSTKQVQGIYSGQIKDWAEIGNFSGQITAYQRGAVTRAGLGKDAPAAKLREWLLSPEGQSIVYQSGYVPISRKSN
jgi:ABC-type phosphate transport system substrate-binding protein